MNRAQIIEEIFFNMDSIRKRMFKPSHMGKQTKAGPTRTQWAVLTVVAESGQKSVKDIAMLFEISPSAAAQLVDGLVKEKLLNREEDVGDRRKVTISLTSKGKAVLAREKKKHIEKFTKVFSPLTDQELLLYKKLQLKIAQGIS